MLLAAELACITVDTLNCNSLHRQEHFMGCQVPAIIPVNACWLLMGGLGPHDPCQLVVSLGRSRNYEYAANLHKLANMVILSLLACHIKSY